LSKAKQDDLYDYCSTVMLKEGVEWIREKFGINLATKTLSAWLINERVDREFGVLLASVEDDARRAYQMEGALSNAPDFPKIVAQMLGQRMFEAMRTGARGTLKKFLQLYTLLISTLIKSDNSKLARAKFEFDGVREVKKYASEVKTILTDKSLHQDTRLERVRTLLFGVPKGAKKGSPASLPPLFPSAAPAGGTPVPDIRSLMKFRVFQEPVVHDMESKILILHWSRQIGKSYALAAWAVNRLLLHPGRLVTVLSNSRDNGAEFVLKAREICDEMGRLFEAVTVESNQAELDGRGDLSESLKYDAMRFEIKFTVKGMQGRIKVLAANPRTARGFSGDLILEEFAFHEDARAIWEAAEPIISSNQDFLLRVASTGNGRRNLFYELCADGAHKVSRMPRSEAWKQGGIKIYSNIDSREITPEEARAEASDKRAYDQNYECAFGDECMALLPDELIACAKRDNGTGIDRQVWSNAALLRMEQSAGGLYLGQDFARSADLSVQVVIEKHEGRYRTLGILEMRDTRTPGQQAQLDLVAAMPAFRRASLDMTGNGLGLYEYASEKHGPARIEGVNFSATEPVSDRIRAEGRRAPTARVTEIMATDLAGVFEARSIEIPVNPELHTDLRKPEKIVSPGGRVSIAASRDAEGHADRFWAYALAIRAARGDAAAGPMKAFPVRTERMTARLKRTCAGA
jgi:phage FluMu gp28-like protein